MLNKLQAKKDTPTRCEKQKRLTDSVFLKGLFTETHLESLFCHRDTKPVLKYMKCTRILQNVENIQDYVISNPVIFKVLDVMDLLSSVLDSCSILAKNRYYFLEFTLRLNLRNVFFS